MFGEANVRPVKNGPTQCHLAVLCTALQVTKEQNHTTGRLGYDSVDEWRIERLLISVMKWQRFWWKFGGAVVGRYSL